jgi:hypothetical protein
MDGHAPYKSHASSWKVKNLINKGFNLKFELAHKGQNHYLWMVMGKGDIKIIINGPYA